MTEPIRVLHFLEELDVGGVESFIMNVYRHVDRSKVQFDFALTSGRKMFYDEEVLGMGGRIYYFDKDMTIPQNLKYILKNCGPFAAIHSHMYFYSGIAVTLARYYGVPVRIAHAHNAHTGEKRSLSRRCYEGAMKVLIRLNATSMVGCSKKACDHVFGKTKRSIMVPNGIDCERFAFNEQVRKRVRNEYCLDEKFVVGHVGHFNPAKNHEKVLSVFAALAKQRDDAALFLVGNGELETEVRLNAEKLGISEKVVFAGAHKDVENMYNAMDVFLFPSRYEGFGMAMIEAQANGLACVASDVVPEDTNADNRTVYLPLDETDDVWADMLLKNQRENSPDKIKKRFDICSVTHSICGMYEHG